MWWRSLASTAVGARGKARRLERRRAALAPAATAGRTRRLALKQRASICRRPPGAGIVAALVEWYDDVFSPRHVLFGRVPPPRSGLTEVLFHSSLRISAAAADDDEAAELATAFVDGSYCLCRKLIDEWAHVEGPFDATTGAPLGKGTRAQKTELRLKAPDARVLIAWENLPASFSCRGVLGLSVIQLGCFVWFAAPRAPVHVLRGADVGGPRRLGFRVVGPPEWRCRDLRDELATRFLGHFFVHRNLPDAVGTVLLQLLFGSPLEAVHGRRPKSLHLGDTKPVRANSCSVGLRASPSF